MSKVKLELQSKDFEGLRLFARAHRDAISGNVTFPTPVPPVAAFDLILSNYEDKLDQITAAENGLGQMRTERGDLRDQLEEALTQRGNYVEDTAAGDAAKIQSAGFQVQADGAPTTSMPKPEGLSATMGDNEGEIDVVCHAVPKAKSYVVEQREHSDVAAPGPWTPGKVGTRSSLTLGGFVSGKKYGLRIRALGPNELESPWSDEVVCMAP